MKDIKKGVIISFLIWNKIKEIIKRDNFDIDIKEIREVIENNKKSLDNKSFDELIESVKQYISDPNSLLIKMFKNLNWRNDYVDPKNVGAVMPKLWDLPKEALLGDLIETVEFVKNHQNYKTSIYIKKLTKICSLLNEFPPIIIDSNYHDQRSIYGGKKTNYYIEDGNHRVIAYILCGNAKLIAYIGTEPFIK